MSSLTISAFLAVVAGIIGWMYRSLSEKNNWGISKVFERRHSLIVLLSFILIISGAIEIFHDLKFWRGLLLLLGAYVTVFLLSQLLKKHLQVAFIIIIALSVIIWIVGGAVIGTTEELNSLAPYQR